MKNKIKILVISNSLYFFSGAEFSLLQLTQKIDRNKFDIVLILPINEKSASRFTQFKIIYLPLIWFQMTINPIRLILYFINLLFITVKLIRIIRSNNIDVIYSNSIKAHVYGVWAKVFSGKKIIWHIRDNIRKGIVNKILLKFTDKIICISINIYNQVNTPKEKKELIYGGIDTYVYSRQSVITHSIRKELNLSHDTRLIAQISQLTPWKNHFDFIDAAKIIIDNCNKVHFIIVGDILNIRDQQYKLKIHNKIRELGICNNITLLGYKENVNEILSQTDIFIHTAVNEPFGRALIEAMSMEIPVIAYNSDGPSEIVINNKTGFLLDPYNFNEIAEKAILLLNNKNICCQYGKAGREVVIEKFNIDRYVREMEVQFN